MWIAWGAWLVNGTIFDVSSVHTLFLYYFSLCCSRFHVVAMLPASKDRNMLQVFFDRKRTCTTNTFVMCKSNCEDFEH